MNDLEIATGVVMAAHIALEYAMKRNEIDIRYYEHGSRAATCAKANKVNLDEAHSLIAKASRILDDARARHSRMIEN